MHIKFRVHYMPGDEEDTHVENIWPPGALISGLMSRSAASPQELKELMYPIRKQFSAETAIPCTSGVHTSSGHREGVVFGRCFYLQLL